MFSKDISKIELADIIDLVVSRREQEGQQLDYKKEFNSNIDKGKIELAKDISAFANAIGGYLIIGVNDSKEVIGVEKTIQSKPVNEWINQVLTTNLEPRVNYSEPRLFELPGTDKVVIVIYIPESISKPHMVKDKHCYFLRVNELSIPANHYNVKEMFELSQTKLKHYEDFREKRNLTNSDALDFALNANSTTIKNGYFEKDSSEPPLVLFSFIPKNIGSLKVDKSLEEFKVWMRENEYYSPYGIYHYHLNNLTPKIDGFTVNRIKNGLKIGYFEVLRNGFFETCFSQQIGGTDNSNGQPFNYLHLTALIGYETALLHYAKKFYEFIGYHEEVLLQISFRNVLGYHLLGHHRTYQPRMFNFPKNENHTNLSIRHQFSPDSITSLEIRDIVKNHSDIISNAFGLEENYGFSLQGEFDLREFSNYYSSS